MTEVSDDLYEELKEDCRKYYPLHMPGHKRRISPAEGFPVEIDTTEVEGTDNLHNAEGILKAAMERTAALYGAAHTWYLVNGSTVGNLAAIRAAAPHGSEVIVARNCHKSVYHAIELGGLRAHYLVPDTDAAFGIYGSVPPEKVREQLVKHPDSRAVILTSPTYEGVVSDIASIAEICHAAGVPLIVDEAHGAHLGLPCAEKYGFPKGAVMGGADLVIQSAHKVLPSFTQTAWLHQNGSLVRPDEVERQLEIFETTSPSYPMLVSLDFCTTLMREHGDERMAGWQRMLEDFDTAAAGLHNLRTLCHGSDRTGKGGTGAHPSFFAHDPGKIVVNAAGAGMTGRELADVLREKYAFETEMSCGMNMLAMTSSADDPAQIARFAKALLEIDAACEKPALRTEAAILPPPGWAAFTIAEALERPSGMVPEERAAGRVLAEYIWAYPPGVPLGAPGEIVTPELLHTIRMLLESGTRVYHRGSGYPAGAIDKQDFRCVS
ncbi:MAG: aminotransferase class I/II-fold pyridoxal phosphate-dependent enzyme [Lachnospiraceae bacterium]|jgi:arginine decarboxylase|nr:aminotransferase class I/II-fold pyridoxal phosphate-dependent enzyme [Lachnospiraceae bacterium]